MLFVKIKSRNKMNNNSIVKYQPALLSRVEKQIKLFNDFKEFKFDGIFE
jgi:hypothetical protein